MSGIQSQLLGILIWSIIVASGVGAGLYADFGRPASGAESGSKFSALMSRALLDAERTGNGVTVAFTTTTSGPVVQVYDGVPWLGTGVSAQLTDNGTQSYPQNVTVSLSGVAGQPPFALFVTPDDRVSAAAWSVGGAPIAQPSCPGSLTLSFVTGAANGNRVTNSYSIGCADGAVATATP